jgi:hypothetical protein
MLLSEDNALQSPCRRAAVLLRSVGDIYETQEPLVLSRGCATQRAESGEGKKTNPTEDGILFPLTNVNVPEVLDPNPQFRRTPTYSDLPSAFGLVYPPAAKPMLANGPYFMHMGCNLKICPGSWKGVFARCDDCILGGARMLSGCIP